MRTSIMLQSFDTLSRASRPQESPPASPARQARDLIGRYPNLSETELARLIHLYRNLTPVDMALMLSDEILAPKLDRFSNKHRSALRLPFRQYAGLLGYAVMAVGAVVWAAAVAST
jgi:hypothetical protein